MRQPVCNGAVHVRFFQLEQRLFLSLSRSAARRWPSASYFLAGDLAGFTQAYDTGHIERAGAHASFVAAAVHLGGHLNGGVICGERTGRPPSFWAVLFYVR